ncbi:hypothetical protein D3C86_1430390 [compost metagenome]
MLGAEDRRQDVGLEGFAQFAVHPLEQGDHLVFDTDVGANRDGLRAQGADLLEHRLGGFFVGLIVDADPIALFGGQQGGGGTDAAAAAGDDDDFIHAGVPPFQA